MADTKTFYSIHGNHVIQVNPGRIEEIDGRKKTVGYKAAEFRPLTSPIGGASGHGSGGGISGYGILTTSDQEVIDCLERLVSALEEAGAEPDIFTSEGFQQRIVPKEQQLAMERQRVRELERKLSDSNRLVETLQQQGQIPTREPEQRRGPGRPRKNPFPEPAGA